MEIFWRFEIEAVVDLLVVYQIFEQQMLINIIGLIKYYKPLFLYHRGCM